MKMNIKSLKKFTWLLWGLSSLVIYYTYYGFTGKSFSSIFRVGWASLIQSIFWTVIPFSIVGLLYQFTKKGERKKVVISSIAGFIVGYLFVSFNLDLAILLPGAYGVLANFLMENLMGLRFFDDHGMIMIFLIGPAYMMVGALIGFLIGRKKLK